MMKKLIIATLLLAFGLLLSWLLYFQPRGYDLASIRDRIVSVVSGRGGKSVRSQSMPPSQYQQRQQQQQWQNQQQGQQQNQQPGQAGEAPQATEITTSGVLEGLDESGVNSVWVTYSLDGELRTSEVFVTIPSGFNDSEDSYPLFFAFHGTSKVGGGAARSTAKSHNSENFITIAPIGGTSEDGTVSSWSANLTGEDDVLFMQTLWDAIKDDSRIDHDRVYAWGSSVGSSFVSNRLVVEADYLRGVMCCSSTAHEGLDISGAPVPTNIINVHGENDPMIPIDGGPTSFEPHDVQMAEEDAVAMWADHNGCSSDPVTTETDDYTEISYSCDNGAVVKLYRLNDTGHNSEMQLSEITGMTTGRFMLQEFANAA